MRSSILLLVLSAAVLGGCTSAYKTSQTPDDVYYSPQRQHDEYVNVKENDDRRYQDQNDGEYYDDRYLRMKVHNRVMWSDLDDYSFYNPRYSYSYYNSLNWNNPWSPYTYWNYSYNPYCSHQLLYSTAAKVTYNHPRIFNLNTYNSTQLTNNNYTNPKGSVYNNNNYNNSNNRPARIIGSYTPGNTNTSSNAGNFLRNIFNGSGNNNNSSSGSSNNSSSKSNSSGSSSSGSSGSSSGGSAPVRRF
jgi:uncharacterized membrane protein YgcG